MWLLSGQVERQKRASQSILLPCWPAGEFEGFYLLQSFSNFNKADLYQRFISSLWKNVLRAFHLCLKYSVSPLFVFLEPILFSLYFTSAQNRIIAPMVFGDISRNSSVQLFSGRLSLVLSNQSLCSLPMWLLTKSIATRFQCYQTRNHGAGYTSKATFPSSSN